jgi:hypothetical protein
MDWEGSIPRKFKENFTVTFKQKANSIIPYDQICDITAQEIANNYNNLYLALSGGADSEHVANVFYRNKIEFTPTILYWKDISNRESEYAFKWCNDHNIEPLVLEYSMDIFTNGEYQNLLTIARPRLMLGVTNMFVHLEILKRNGNLVTGMQVEHHPDVQFIGKEGIPTEYKGFLINESDAYFETDTPNRQPWAFFYWSPEIMASTIHHWDTSLDMTRAKEKLYNIEHRPKMNNPEFVQNIPKSLFKSRYTIGTIDCALLGNKIDLLNTLLE